MGEVAGAQQALEKSAYAAESKARAHPRVALSGGFPLGACAVRATALGPKVRKTFRLFDYNADGRISVDEFKVGRYRAAPGREGTRGQRRALGPTRTLPTRKRGLAAIGTHGAARPSPPTRLDKKPGTARDRRERRPALTH